MGRVLLVQLLSFLPLILTHQAFRRSSGVPSGLLSEDVGIMSVISWEVIRDNHDCRVANSGVLAYKMVLYLMGPAVS